MNKRKNLLISFLFLILLFLFSLPISAAESLQVHFIDVGQGDSSLIVCGEHAMLFDAGKNEDSAAIIDYIKNKAGVQKLDYVIGSHPHEDHIGALDTVIYQVDVQEVLLPEVTTTTKTFTDVLEAVESKNLGITVPEVGEEYALGNAKFVILGPVGDYKDDLNNWSIAIKLTYQNTSFVFTGDAETEAETDILGTGLDLHANVFQAGHHGSGTSNSDAMLDAISPEAVVISCGAGNSYGHPHIETLERLKARNIQMFRTDEQGTIVAVSNGNKISWDKNASQNWLSGNGYTSSADRKKSQEVPSVTMVHITETGSKYHSAGCQYLSSSDIEISLSDAKARGLEPCSRCNPPS